MILQLALLQSTYFLFELFNGAARMAWLFSCDCFSEHQKREYLLLVSGAWALLPPLYARAEGDAGVAPAIPRCPVRATPAWPAGWRVPPPMPCLGLGSPSATAPPLPRHAAVLCPV
eukprot:EG_transcript_32136